MLTPKTLLNPQIQNPGEYTEVILDWICLVFVEF